MAARVVGDVYDYHHNGRLYSKRVFAEKMTDFEQMQKFGILPAQVEIVFAKDSLGQDMVIDGNGYYKQYDDLDSNSIEAEGRVVGGKWDGEVTGKLMDLKLSFIEQYKKGVLISGTSKDSLGNSYVYTHHTSVPRYPKGLDEFSWLLQKNLRGIPFKGRIYVQFFIDVNGDLVEPKILRKLDSAIEEQVLTTLLKSEKWEPARKKGVPYKMKLNLPINL